MFGLGPTELIVILVLALLVLGPQRIPDAATSLGRAIRSFRRATRELRDQIDIDDDVRRPFEDLHAALRDEPQPLSPFPLSTGLSAPAATPGTPSALVQPPADPVVSSASELAGDGSTAAAAGAAGADSPGTARAVSPALSVPQPVLSVPGPQAEGAATAKPVSGAASTGTQESAK